MRDIMDIEVPYIATSDFFNDFMLLTYFGITQEDDMQTIQNKCANRAYQDLARTIDYEISAEKLKTMGKEAVAYNNQKKKFISEINEEIVSSIQQMPNPNEYEIDTYRCVFDELHERTCKKIVERTPTPGLIKGNKPLTYGQAQKWLNMTIKYMRFFNGIFPDPNRRFESALHVPVDHFILQAAWEAEGTSNKYSEKVIQFPLNPDWQNNGKSGAFSDGKNGKVVAWSNWNENQYKKFQESLRKWLDEQRLWPMEWEAKAWMKAKKASEGNPEDNQH